ILMPFYEYECPSCKFYSEVLQKISDRPLKKCPSCGKPGFKKLVSAPVFRLKGSGWYETDFKSDKDNQRNLAGPEREESGGDTKPVAEAKPAADAKAASDAKTDSKTDAKGDAKGGGKGDGKGDAKASGDARPAAESKGGKESRGKSSARGGAAASKLRTRKPAPRAAVKKAPKRGGKRR
ncbi:MAG: zinc ribbon domain-containing protein, partial [Steroidobacteraceae bacterium]